MRGNSPVSAIGGSREKAQNAGGWFPGCRRYVVAASTMVGTAITRDKRESNIRMSRRARKVAKLNIAPTPQSAHGSRPRRDNC